MRTGIDSSSKEEFGVFILDAVEIVALVKCSIAIHENYFSPIGECAFLGISGEDSVSLMCLWPLGG